MQTPTANTILANLRVHAEDRNIDLALLDRVERWLATFQREVGTTWRDPDQLFYCDAEKHIEFTWHGERDITIEVAIDTATYIRSWGTAISDFECGPCSTQQERIGLWQWMREQEGI